MDVPRKTSGWVGDRTDTRPVVFFFLDILALCGSSQSPDSQIGVNDCSASQQEYMGMAGQPSLASTNGAGLRELHHQLQQSTDTDRRI
ncbi:hypothetical protein PGTUg99_027443 [Puccinia graminis f. sp. tritici]|uniref:Uncharacterized protein n=1 Tax=Puccinia graminis f. sp. tritici TaxID=56615 RepID=A0A5B0RFA8_PUCGR|nr:hypothetical protein PGTUg99_027443 [Puccinia graminis f. sp. tritici]